MKKNVPTIFRQYLRHILTDCKNALSITLYEKCAAKWLSNISTYHNRIAALLCEI